MDLMCRDSEKYSALMLYRLFPAKEKETFKGNVNSIYFWWVYYEGFPGF